MVRQIIGVLLIFSVVSVIAIAIVSVIHQAVNGDQAALFLCGVLLCFALLGLGALGWKLWCDGCFYRKHGRDKRYG